MLNRIILSTATLLLLGCHTNRFPDQQSVVVCATPVNVIAFPYAVQNDWFIRFDDNSVVEIPMGIGDATIMMPYEEARAARHLIWDEAMWEGPVPEDQMNDPRFPQYIRNTHNQSEVLAREPKEPNKGNPQ